MLFEPRTGPSTAPVETNTYARRSGGSRERSQTGEIITPEGALSVSAVLAAFTIIAEDISSLPLIEYRRKTRGKERAYGDPYYVLMHDRPNPEHTSMVFRELMVSHLLAWGNFYGQMIWDDAGVVTEIWPLRPDRMTVERVKGQRVFTYMTNEGKPRKFNSDDILHIPAFGFDGLIGYSRIALARNAIGLAISAEKFGSKFFANDARPGIVLKHPQKIGDKAYEHLRDSWNEDHKGADNSWKPAILEEGMDLATIGMPMQDAQFLQTRQFQVSEIARIFRVPPHMIGDVTNTTSWGSGIDSQEQGYVSHTLRPWMVRIEQSLSQQLLLAKDRNNLYFEHLADGLVRGDLATRYEAYVKAINNGFMSPNEARSRENMNPYEGGDEFYHPLNMGNSKDVKPGKADALQPLFLDTCQRIVRREMNDLRGAAKRYLAKHEYAEFHTWVNEFYGTEHAEFAQRQMQPLLDAQKRLFGLDMTDAFQDYIDVYLSQREVELQQRGNLAELEADIETWLRQTPAEMTAAICGGLNG
jgi:HK97 family phage portal protein